MKKFLIFCLVLITLGCLALDAWYLIVLNTAPERVVSQTYHVSEQVAFKTDGTTETHNFIDINIYDDVFEVKFNYLLDEEQKSFYSQGKQFVLKPGKTNVNFDGSYTEKVTSEMFATYKESSSFNVSYYKTPINHLYTNKQFDNLEVYNYASGNDYESTLISTNPIDKDSSFRIQIEDELYLMKFKYDDIKWLEEFKINETTTQVDSKSFLLSLSYYYNVDSTYRTCDVDYFCELLFNASKSIAVGTDAKVLFEFGDLFNYYKCIDLEKGIYAEQKLESDALSKLVAKIANYYSIGVTKHEGIMSSSDDSIFNCYKGNSNYHTEGETAEFYIGSPVVSVDTSKFEFVATETSGEYYLSLDKGFIDAYKDYNKSIELDIVIDLDYLKSLNINFLGVKKDSLEGFKIFNAETVKTIDGIVTKGEIVYV